MKTLIPLILLFTGVVLFNQTTDGQCRAYIMVDNKLVQVDPTPTHAGLVLPMWLNATENIAVAQGVNSIQVMEFTINGTSLAFSRVVSVTSTSPVSVSAGTVWKVESIVEQPTGATSGGSITYYVNPTANTFTVPSCVDYICVAAWGGGGGGGAGGSNPGGAGGGGGGYAQGCYTVSPGATYSIAVGGGGNGGGNSGNGNGSTGGTTTVSGTGISISVTGGGGGAGSAGGSGTGGSGGSGSGGSTINSTGGAGLPSFSSSSNNYAGAGGGNGANGGLGGASNYVEGSNSNGNPGIAPGGGGGAANGDYSGTIGGAGAAGQVTISW